MFIESIKYMLMAQDMNRATRFYRNVLGLEVKFESPQWTELAHGDAIVALHGGGTGAYQKTGLSIQVRDIVAACKEIESGATDFARLESYILQKGEAAANASGRQEYLENVINRYLR